MSETEAPGRAIDIETIGEEVPLLEGIRTTRAIRRLRPDPVPRALIRKVCEAGTFAPSGGNRQPWHFVAVTDPERRRWVAERYPGLVRRVRTRVAIDRHTGTSADGKLFSIEQVEPWLAPEDESEESRRTTFVAWVEGLTPPAAALLTATA